MARNSQSNRDVDKLRSEARKRRNAVTRKIARNRREKGLNVGGTEYDPRRDPNAIERMNSNQLRSYIGKLNSFTSRKTQFLPTAGEPISTSDWAKLEASQERANKRSNARAARLGKLKVPIGDMTVKERSETLHGPNTRKTADGGVINSPFPQWNHKPENITGPEAARQLAKMMSKRTNPKREKENLAGWRRSAVAMLHELGLSDLTLAVEEMTAKQFEYLWLSGLADKIAPIYAIFKTRNSGRKTRWYDDASQDQSQQIKDYIKAAQQIKRTS